MNKEFRILNNKTIVCGNGTAYDEKHRKNRKNRLKSFGFENILLKLSKWKSQIGNATQKKIKLPIDNLNLCMVEFIPRLKRSAYDCSLKTERDDQYIHTRKTSIS